jgi:prevent-host-death family protein
MPIILGMRQKTIAEVGQNFTKAAREAERTPIEITRHGRRVLVLLSTEEYERLKRPFPERLRQWIAEHAPVPGDAEDFSEQR